MSVIKSDPGVDNVVAFTGGQGSSNGGFIFMSLKPLNVRKVSATQILARLRPKMLAMPVASVFLQPAQDLRIGGRQSNALYQYTIQSDTAQDLAHWGPILLREMKKLPGFQDVNSDQQNGGLDQYLTYDRNTAARLGITAQGLDSTLYSAFGQSEVSIIYTQLNQYYVVLEVAPQFWQTPEGLKYIYVSSAERRKRAAQLGGHRAVAQHPTIGQPYRPVSIGHRFLQSRGGHGAQRRYRGSGRDAGEAEYAADRPRLFCRDRAGVPDLTGERADPDCHRFAGGLHRAGNSL